MATNDQKPIKKPYHAPQLVVYGDIRELTEATAAMVGRSDGAYGNLLKTG